MGKSQDNLILLGNNPERDLEIRRKGQQAQAEKKRQRKTLKETLLALLESKDANGKTHQENIGLALIMKALDGDVSAYKAIESSIGETQATKIDATVNDENKNIMKEYLESVKNGKK